MFGGHLVHWEQGGWVIKELQQIYPSKETDTHENRGIEKSFGGIEVSELCVPGNTACYLKDGLEHMQSSHSWLDREFREDGAPAARASQSWRRLGLADAGWVKRQYDGQDVMAREDPGSDCEIPERQVCQAVEWIRARPRVGVFHAGIRSQVG